MVPGISNHEHARQWQPGAGGLCLHTIVRDGERMHLGISTGGHYLSEDRGKTFKASNKGVGAGFAPDPYPEFGQCVHKIAQHEDAPGRLYAENGGGWADTDRVVRDRHRQRAAMTRALWRSTRGLPTDFGFACRHTAQRRQCNVMPLEPRRARPRWRPQSGARKWWNCGAGPWPPKKETYFTVLRNTP
jgi:hypothetical protein